MTQPFNTSQCRGPPPFGPGHSVFQHLPPPPPRAPIHQAHVANPQTLNVQQQHTGPPCYSPGSSPNPMKNEAPRPPFGGHYNGPAPGPGRPNFDGRWPHPENPRFHGGPGPRPRFWRCPPPHPPHAMDPNKKPPMFQVRPHGRQYQNPWASAGDGSAFTEPPRCPPPRHNFRGPAPGQHGQKRDASNHGGNNRAKRKKTKDRAPADSCPFYCSTCDKGYKVEDMYKQHIATHVKCGKDGCPYVAAERLVQLHQEMQHRDGIASKIWKLESKEDIEKWRAERKKNFPTKENLEKKKAIHQDKVNRGEVLETKLFSKLGKRHDNSSRGRHRRGRGRGRGRWKGGDRQGVSEETEGHTNKDMETDNNVKKDDCSLKNSPKKRDSSDPLSLVLDANGHPIGEDSPSSCKSSEKHSPPQIGGGLSSLMAAYDESTSGDEEDGEITASIDTKMDVSHISNGKPDSSSSAPKANGRVEKNSLFEITKNDKDDLGHGINSKRGVKRKGKNTQQQAHDVIPKKQLSLLEKLLASEIRHERNVILQCVRYIVKHDFFGTRDNNNTKATIAKNPHSESHPVYSA